MALSTVLKLKQKVRPVTLRLLRRADPSHLWRGSVGDCEDDAGEEG